MRLEGKAIIVTGAAGGLGRQYAIRFAREGAPVAGLDGGQPWLHCHRRSIPSAGLVGMTMRRGRRETGLRPVCGAGGADWIPAYAGMTAWGWVRAFEAAAGERKRVDYARGSE